jgi:hypothetical protein
MENLLTKTLEEIETERYEYLTKRDITVLFQRLTKTSMWYAVSGNQIVNWSQYRNDLEEWCDIAL